MINGHSCISDDGGTPNRKCYGCEDEKRAIPISDRVHKLSQAFLAYEFNTSEAQFLLDVIHTRTRVR
jgi:hypothetical protein